MSIGRPVLPDLHRADGGGRLADRGARKTDRLRTLLDAFIIGMSLFTISWVDLDRPVIAAAGERGHRTAGPADQPRLPVRRHRGADDGAAQRQPAGRPAVGPGGRGRRDGADRGVGRLLRLHGRRPASSHRRFDDRARLDRRVRADRLRGTGRRADRRPAPSATARLAGHRADRRWRVGRSMLPYVPLVVALIVVGVEPPAATAADRVTGAARDRRPSSACSPGST